MGDVVVELKIGIYDDAKISDILRERNMCPIKVKGSDFTLAPLSGFTNENALCFGAV